jgi:hypothetical protein
MSENDRWPEKPPEVTEKEWHRQAEAALKVSVISSEEKAEACPECGTKGMIFNAQVYPSRSIISVCKGCILTRVEQPEHLWVRADPYLRKHWLMNGKDPAQVERMARMARLRQGASRKES